MNAARPPLRGTDFILEITLVNPSVEEQVQARLFLTASTGSSSSDAIISAYFESAADCEIAAKALSDIDGIELRTLERSRVDWLRRYQQSLEPMLIGKRFAVAPDATLLPHLESRFTIVVPQEQAFGTGSHETTSLCMELLETIPLEGARCLDIGSGSGILAIAMQRLGASKIIAFDNDTDAYAALRENRTRNGIDPRVMSLFIGSVEALRGGTFGVVTMNIIPEVILPLLASVKERLAPEGRLLLSGVLVTRRGDVVSAARGHQLALEEERVRGEWWAGVFSSELRIEN